MISKVIYYVTIFKVGMISVIKRVRVQKIVTELVPTLQITQCRYRRIGPKCRSLRTHHPRQHFH